MFQKSETLSGWALPTLRDVLRDVLTPFATAIRIGIAIAQNPQSRKLSWKNNCRVFATRANPHPKPLCSGGRLALKFHNPATDDHLYSSHFA